MKTHRFYIEDQKLLENDEITISDKGFNHQIKHVLRLQENNPIIFLDGLGKEYHCHTKVLLKKESIFSKIKVKSYPQDVHSRILLAPSVIKKDKLEYVIQKCTEIGVSQFSPIISERTEKLNVNKDRLKKIIVEAVEQSEKTYLPTINGPQKLEECLINNPNAEKYYLEIDAPIIDLESIKDSKKDIIIFIGPEGGWGDIDKNIFDKHSVKPVSIGKTVLRAETASIALSSLIYLI